MFRIIISGFLLIISSLHANAQDCDSIELSFYDMRICMAEKVSDLDKQLIDAVLELQLIIPKAYSTSTTVDESTTEEVLASLNKSQAVWSSMVSVDCELSYEMARGGSGSAAPLAFNQCLVLHYSFRLTQINDRIKEINNML